MTTRSFSSVDTGEALPPLDIETTAVLVVGGALASRDYTPVHHDRAAAQAQGLPADPPEVAPAPQLDFHEQWVDHSDHFDAA